MDEDAAAIGMPAAWSRGQSGSRRDAFGLAEQGQQQVLAVDEHLAATSSIWLVLGPCPRMHGVDQGVITASVRVSIAVSRRAWPVLRRCRRAIAVGA